jgi:hypothetical protein
MTATGAAPARDGHHPAVPGTSWKQERHDNVEAFLASRRLDAGWLTDVLTAAVGPGELLLTSSPVHGLANPTSDLDVIRIADGPLEGPRIATKIFERGHHLEVVSFTTGELRAALARLAELAALPAAAAVARVRDWDKSHEPRRKQTERIVNGVTFDGRMPYLEALPALATVWARQALHLAVEHVALLALAEAAGERRGRVGYAMNAVLHLADCLLSLHGDVYTTRKWFLLRWARARSAVSADPALRDAAAAVEHLRAGVAGALHDPAPLLPTYAETARLVAVAVTGDETPRVRFRMEEAVTSATFLIGARMLVSPRACVAVPDADLPVDDPTDLVLLGGVDPATARAALAALRAGLAKLHLESSCTWNTGGSDD